MTGKERISRILQRKPVDRIGLFEVFWRETAARWAREGHIERPEAVADHFDLDVRRAGGEITPMTWKLVNLVADIDTPDEIVEETQTARLVRDGNGAVLRWMKNASNAPEHVGFRVRDRRGWEEFIRPHLLDERNHARRIDWDRYRQVRQHCQRRNAFFCAGAVGAFDLMAPMCGHEHLLVGMAEDPDWVRQMAITYADVTIRLLELLFAREGLPDGLWVWDDLGFRDRPFMSPAMYRELLLPAHKRLFDFAHSRGLPVVLHADGFVEPLIPHLIDAGIDCLQPLEAKAGMDVVRLKQRFGDRLAFIGNIDARVLETNDLPAVKAELERKVPAAMRGGGYVLQVDHSVPPGVNYETYRYFVETGLKIGTLSGAP